MHNNSPPPSRSLQSHPSQTKHPSSPRTKTLPWPRTSPSTLHYIPANTQHIHPIPRRARRHTSPPHTTHLKPPTPLPSIPPQCNSPPYPPISRTPLIPHMCHITHPPTITRHSHQPSPETPQNRFMDSHHYPPHPPTPPPYESDTYFQWNNKPYTTTVQFLTTQHIDLTPTTQRHPTDRNNTLHPETIYSRYQTSPIFASNGSYNSSTTRTGAGIALLALDHPLTFTPNLTDQAWHNSFTTPLLFASHLLPPKIGSTQMDVNHGEAHALALALMHAPKTYPALFILDSKHVFRFIIQHFTSHTTTNRNTVRNIHPSITTFYSGIITTLLQHHHLSPPLYTASPIDLSHEELL